MGLTTTYQEHYTEDRMERPEKNRHAECHTAEWEAQKQMGLILIL